MLYLYHTGLCITSSIVFLTRREVKEQLLDLSLRRVGNWDGPKPQKPSEEVALPTSQNSSEPSSNCSPHAQATSPVPPTLQPPSNMAQNVSPLSPNILQQQFSKQHISSPPFPSAFPQQMFPMPPNVQSMPGPLSPPAVLQTPSYQSQQFSQSPSSAHGYPSPGGSERQGMFSSHQLASNQGQFSPHYYVNSQQSNTMPSLPQPQQQQPDIFDGTLSSTTTVLVFNSHLYRGTGIARGMYVCFGQ